jgi:iron complex outermembrane recepter protein
VRGALVESGQPLPWIPPLQGKLGLSHRSGPLRLGATIRAAGDQHRTGEFEEPTRGYVSLDAFAQYYLSGGRLLHTFNLVAVNVTDSEYRDHLSRVKSIMPEPGRNLRLLYRVYF